jgi:hypothetical protein
MNIQINQPADRPVPVSVTGVTIDSGGLATDAKQDTIIANTAKTPANTSTTAVTPSQGRKAVTAAGTPEALVGSLSLVESVHIQARKNVTTANTGNIYLGFSSSAGSNYLVLAPGDEWSWTAPPGKKLDLHLIYVDAATSADAVTYTAAA